MRATPNQRCHRRVLAAHRGSRDAGEDDPAESRGQGGSEVESRCPCDRTGHPRPPQCGRRNPAAGWAQRASPASVRWAPGAARRVRAQGQPRASRSQPVLLAVPGDVLHAATGSVPVNIGEKHMLVPEDPIPVRQQVFQHRPNFTGYVVSGVITKLPQSIVVRREMVILPLDRRPWRSRPGPRQPSTRSPVLAFAQCRPGHGRCRSPRTDRERGIRPGRAGFPAPASGTALSHATGETHVSGHRLRMSLAGARLQPDRRIC